MPSGLLPRRVRVVLALALSFFWLVGLVAFAVSPARAQAAEPDVGRRLVDPPPSVTPIKAGAAVLIVQPVAGGGITSDEFLQRRINTHAATIASEQHLRRVIGLAQGEARKTNWFKESDNPLERAAWLRDHLKVTALAGTSLIQVTLDDVADPAERKAIVQEICATYLDNQRQAHNNDLLDQTASLNNVRIRTEAALKELRSAMREKQVQLNLSGGGGNPGRAGVKEIELSKLVQEQVESQLAAAKARGALDALKAALDRGQDPPQLDALVAASNPFLADDAAQIRQLERDRDGVAVEVGENGAKLKALDARIDRTRVRHQKELEEARAKARVTVREAADQEAAAAQSKSEALTSRINLLREELGELNDATAQYFNLQQQEKGLNEQLRAVKQQIDQIMAAQSSHAVADIQWHLMPEATR